VLRAVHAGTRLVLAAHPTEPGRADAVWLAGGRVVDWAPLGGDEGTDRAELAARTAEALRAAPRPGDLGAWLPADELDEVRLVGAWLAANPARVLELDSPAAAERVEGFVERVLSAGPKPTTPGARPS
jgi:DNA polymerase III subunit epsilon